MWCPNCNSEIKDGMRFCPKCGTEIPQKRFCSECGTELKGGTRFCSNCGKELAKPWSNDNNQIPNHESLTPKLKQNISNPLHKAEICKENSMSRRVMLICAVIIFFLIIFGVLPNLLQESNQSYSNIDNNSSYSNTYREELEDAQNELQKAADELNEILQYYQSVIAQYGGGQMAVLAASQNNPQLFRNFDSAESYYERCFETVASIYDKMGYPESANSYRENLRLWRMKIQRMKGMY